MLKFFRDICDSFRRISVNGKLSSARLPEHALQMKRHALTLTICHLALSLGASGYIGNALAIPADQSDMLSGTQPLPDFSSVVQPLEPSAPPVIQAATPPPGQAAAPAGESTGQNAATAPAGTETAEAIPCMVSFEGEDIAEDSCDDSADRKLSVQFGQRMNGGKADMLGEFDGIRVDYRLAGGVTLNGVAGYPVMSDQDKFNSARQVFGVSANTARFARSWDLNSYLLEEQDNGQARRNAGGALRYLRPKRSLLLLFDYDMAQSSLDAFTASGAVALPRSTTLSATYDRRSTPLRRQQRKYLQQSMTATNGWSWNMPTDRITYFTRDLSEEVSTLSVGLTHTFSSRLKLSGSAAVLDVCDKRLDSSDAPPSEYFYHLQLSGSDLMFRGNSNVLDLSHSITDTTRTSSATFDTRYTINRRWKVSPRLRTDYRDNLLERSVQWVTAPSVRMEYQWRDRYGVKIEAGGEWTSRELYDQAISDSSSYFVKLGYKANF